MNFGGRTKQNFQAKEDFKIARELRELLSKGLWWETDNLSLKLMKFVPFIGDKDREKTDIRKFKSVRYENALHPYCSYLDSYMEMLKQINAKVWIMRTKSRLVIGLGDESVYETSIRLLRNYGVPYIPGSALKGVAKHYALELLADKYWELFLKKFRDEFKKLKLEENVYGATGFVQNAFEKEENLKKLKELNLTVTLKDGTKITAAELVDIFGTLGNEGKVVFFDALLSPVKNPPVKPEQLKSLLQNILEFDIMNPHYQPYYQESKPPGDWYSPVPIIFLTVKKDVPFVFAVGPSKTCDDERLVEKAYKILKEALVERGVGAKTALGYGRFA